jgi:ATP-dependent DNA ligase
MQQFWTAIAPSASNPAEKRFSILETTRTSTSDSRRSQKALGDLPDDTVIDGEVVALDESGRPDFSPSSALTRENSTCKCESSPD